MHSDAGIMQATAVAVPPERRSPRQVQRLGGEPIARPFGAPAAAVPVAEAFPGSALAKKVVASCDWASALHATGSAALRRRPGVVPTLVRDSLLRFRLRGVHGRL